MNERTWQNLLDKRESGIVLKPQRRLWRLHSIMDPDTPANLPKWAHDDYIFAFPDNLAEQAWSEYPQCERELEVLMRDIGNEIIAVKFDILPEDQSYVVDRAHYADFQWGVTTDRAEAITKYALSRVRTNRYNGSFRMPELLIKNPVPIERVCVHSKFERLIVRSGDGWKGILRQLQ